MMWTYVIVSLSAGDGYYCSKGYLIAHCMQVLCLCMMWCICLSDCVFQIQYVCGVMYQVVLGEVKVSMSGAPVVSDLLVRFSTTSFYLTRFKIPDNLLVGCLISAD